jgi:exosortase/archaeosortase family protein
MTATSQANSLKDQLKNPMIRFMLKAGLVYVLWECLNWFQMHNDAFHTIWYAMHGAVRDNIVFMSAGILKMLQYDITQYNEVIIIKGSAGVAVGPACVGFGLLFGFAGLIISYHGAIKSKLWFIAVGLLGIHTINILRIVILAIISKINNDWVDFNHKYVFNTIIYIFMFLMFTWWVRYVEKQEKASSTSLENMNS